MFPRLLLLSLLFFASCYRQSYPVTPQIADSSTYVITDGRHYGTAWVVADHYLITAGHVCNAFPDPWKLQLINPRGQVISARAVQWEYKENSSNTDLCLLKTEGSVGPPLVLANRPPNDGDEVFFVGAPSMVWGTYKGHYSENPMPLWSYPGASGSAVATGHGVIGVLVSSPCIAATEDECIIADNNRTNAVPVEVVKRFLADADVSWTGEPGIPAEPESWRPGYLAD